MQRLTARFLLSLLLLLVVVPARPATVPAEWQITDYPSEPLTWWGVEVARFPSEALAEGVATGLRNLGWGPVIVTPAEGKESTVIVGEVTDIGQAWYLQEELKRRQVAEGRLVVLPMGDTPRGFVGPVGKPFVAEFGSSVEEELAFAEEMRVNLEDLIRELDPERTAPVRAMIRKLSEGAMTDPDLGRGAAEGARLFWDRQVAPETALYMASRVASGEWTLDAKNAALRKDAQDLTFELLYGHRRDWAGAWAAAGEMERQYPGELETVALSRLRRTALLVDLIERKAEPRPTMADIRMRLRETLEMTPEESASLRARIEYVYIQSFAWEGNWGRVEQLARPMIERHDLRNPHGAMARVLFARSLERKRDYQFAVDHLTKVINNPVLPADYLRFGMTALNPADQAREARRVIQDAAFADQVLVIFRDRPIELPEEEKAAPEETDQATDATREDEDGDDEGTASEKSEDRDD